MLPPMDQNPAHVAPRSEMEVKNPVHVDPSYNGFWLLDSWSIYHVAISVRFVPVISVQTVPLFMVPFVPF